MSLYQSAPPKKRKKCKFAYVTDKGVIRRDVFSDDEDEDEDEDDEEEEEEEEVCLFFLICVCLFHIAYTCTYAMSSNVIRLC